MKKFFCILTLALLTVGSCNENDYGSLENEINDLKDRVVALERWATTVNSNITALQNIVTALQDMDYVTGVTTFTAPSPGGYVISFVKSGSITISNGADGATGATGKNGADGSAGESPQISVKQDADGVYYWTLNGEWITANGNKMRVTGEKGADGSDGQDGATPQMRINSGFWEISYNNGGTWTSLGVAPTDGQDGQDGITPKLRVNSGTGFWEISYDNGSTWTSLGVKAKGDDGNNGSDGVSPKIRINSVTGFWETSYDAGASWTTTGIKAAGEKGDKGDAGDNGDAVFAANGVDYSNSDYVEFTLADGTSKIKVPKYKKLGLNYAQPGTFAAGETKTVSYTPEGDVAIIKFLNLSAGWKVNVNYAGNKFTVTAPATFNNNNRGGEIVVLVSDNDQNTIMRTINLISNLGGGDDGGNTGGGDDGGGDDGGNTGGGDDGGTPSGPAGYITVEGYSGNTLTVYYTDGTYSTITKSVDSPLFDSYFSVPASNKVIESIVFEEGLTVIAGRKADGSVISLKLSGGNLVFRNLLEGYIPIGTYSEFRLIRMSTANLGGAYGQEFDLDLLNLEWTPIGNSSSRFTGTFDGNHHTLANLKISGNNGYVGLFGCNDGTIKNVHIISGSVSGRNSVGGICGWNGYNYNYNCLISGCSNASAVLGESEVGGVCGYNSSSSSSSSSSITACYNTGSVSGNNRVGGVCGYNSYSSITACYNTGSVSGNGEVGGVCGYNSNSSSSITACYNTGSVSGNSYVGGVCGYGTSIAACYWKDITGDKADYGMGTGTNTGTNTGTTIFALDAWPIPETHLQWGTGDGSGDGKYWKSLGGWYGGNPIYPKLWYE